MTEINRADKLSKEEIATVDKLYLLKHSREASRGISLQSFNIQITAMSFKLLQSRENNSKFFFLNVSMDGKKEKKEKPQVSLTEE